MPEFNRVFLIDDDSAIRSSLERALSGHNYEVESFASAESFLNRSNPHAFGCVVLEVCLPGMDGLALQRHLRAAGRSLPLVFFSSCNELSTAVRAIKAGAVEYLPKPASLSALVGVVRAVLAQHSNTGLALLAERHATLTSREREVLKRIGAGLPNQTIADDLGISVHSVKSHRASIMARMQAHSAAQLMHIAARLEAVQGGGD